MIVFEDRSWQTDSSEPDTNYLEGIDCEQPKWVVHDNSDIAAKVMSNPYWEPVEDEKGQLIDIDPIDPPVSDDGAVERLKNKLNEIERLAILPLRAIAAGTDTDEDRSILIDLENQAKAIRQQLSEIEGGIVQIKD